MKIENALKCTVYFPYAGVSPKNGRDLDAGEITGELEATRFLDGRLQKDAKAGKIKVYLNEADKETLGQKAMEDIKTQANTSWAVPNVVVNNVVAAPVVKEVKKEVIKEIKKEVKFEPQVLPPVEAIKLDNVDIGALNKPAMGQPVFTDKPKATVAEISQFNHSMV